MIVIMVGPNTAMIIISVVSALIYSGQVSVVLQKVNEVLHWKLGCNPIHSVGNVSLHYFAGRGKGEVIRLLLEDHKISYTETRYTMDDMSWPAAKSLGIDDGLYVFGEIPAIETIRGKRLVQRKTILHYLGRSIGLDCDCRDIDWCDMIASGVDDLRRLMDSIVFKEPKFDPLIRDYYVKNILITWLGYFEKLAPSLDTYDEGIYFASGRLTWLDYSVFDMLESNCNLMDYQEGVQHEFEKLDTHLNCTQVFVLFARLNTFYNYFKERPNIHTYVHGEWRPKFGKPFW